MNYFFIKEKKTGIEHNRKFYDSDNTEIMFRLEDEEKKLLISCSETITFTVPLVKI